MNFTGYLEGLRRRTGVNLTPRKRKGVEGNS